MKNNKIFATLLIIIGALLLIWELYIYLSTYTPKGWSTIEGKVASLRLIRAVYNVYIPTVEYHVSDEVFSVEGRVAYQYRNKPSIGSMKLVSYNPINPSESIVVEENKFYVFSLPNIISGFILICLALYLYLKRQKI